MSAQTPSISAQTTTTRSEPLLEVRDLRVEFDTYGGTVQAVRGIDVSVEPGKTLAIVGESGCGKSVSVQSILGLIPKPTSRYSHSTCSETVSATRSTHG